MDSQRPTLDDFDRFRLPNGAVPVVSLPGAYELPRHVKGQRFLKGPIPWWWLTRAGHLPGKALHVAIVVWQRAFMTRSATVQISLSGLAKDMGVLRDAARRGLDQLEQAGLVRVVRRAGRRPSVTILNTVPK